MSDTAAIILFAVLFVSGCSIVLYIQSILKKRREILINSEAEKYIKRLNNPDFEGLEKHFNCSLPISLKELYLDKVAIAREDILIAVPNPAENESESYIAYFEPLDLEALENLDPAFENLLPFANNGAGDLFMFDPQKQDPNVIYFLHETDKLVDLNVKLSDFLKAPFRQQPDE